jgi:Fe-S-cluster containining protein
LTTNPLIRHDCLACGGSCQGTRIPIVNDTERASVEVFARLLERERPIVDGFLRMVQGACLFLDDDNLCSLHKTYGAKAKPTVCKQFPMVATQTGETLRVQVDPACYTAMSSWQNGTTVPDQPLIAATISLDATEVSEEERVLQILKRETTVGGVLHRLSGSSSRKPTPPKGFEDRLVRLIQGAKLSDLLQESKMGVAFSGSISGVAAVEQADFARPRKALSRTRERWAIEATHRVVWLRLTPNVPTVRGVALLTLTGALLADWVSDNDADYAKFLAGWVRALRSPLFVGRLVSNTEALRALLVG